MGRGSTDTRGSIFRSPCLQSEEKSWGEGGGDDDVSSSA